MRSKRRGQETAHSPGGFGAKSLPSRLTWDRELICASPSPVSENKEMDFKAKHIDDDREYNQTDDAGYPVPELGSLLVPLMHAALEHWEMDQLQAYAGHRTYSIGPRSCRDRPEL